MLTIPVNGVEIQTVDGVKYLVAKLEDTMTCAEYAQQLQAGKPVVVPATKRGHLTSMLKKMLVYTKYTTIPGGQWVTFIPCEKRDFKCN
jgi:hypothetical protein